MRVLGELLRGDRLPAHLPGLDQDLQVAREAGGDAERKPVAVAVGRAARLVGAVLGDRRRRSRADSMQGARERVAVEDELADDRGRRPRPPGSARDSVASRRSSVSMSTSRSSNRGPPASSQDRRPRLVAQVAARAPVERHRPAQRTRASQLEVIRVRGRLDDSAPRRRSSPRCRCRARGGDQLQLEALGARRARRPARAGGALAATPPPSATARQLAGRAAPRARAQLGDELADDRGLEARREVGAARAAAPSVAELADRVERARSSGR